MGCVVCGADNGGVYTNGDGYGDGKYVGVTPPPWGFWCWEHSKQAPNLDRQIDAAFAEHGLCGFLEAWIGRCRNLKPCEKHASQRCWKCGAPAVRNCPDTSTLVCGVPECAEHPHSEDHQRRWDEWKRKEAEAAEKKQRELYQQLKQKYEPADTASTLPQPDETV